MNHAANINASAVRSNNRGSLAGLLGAAIFIVNVGISNAAVTQCVGPAGVGLCPTSATSCLVSGPVAVAPGAFIDCSGKDITISGSGAEISVTGGSFALAARNMTIDQGRLILANESLSVQTGFSIDLSGYLTLNGELRARNAGRGSYIVVQAVGNITMNGANPAIDVTGANESCDGGEVHLISNGTVRVQKRIDANGKEGGTENNINFGGTVIVDAGGSVIVEDEIRAHGRWFDGGFVQLLSDSTIFIDYQQGSGLPKGEIDVEGRNMEGYGGTVDLIAANSIAVSGPISAGGGINNAGGDGGGGTFSALAGCAGIVLDDLVDLTGGSGGGGVLMLESSGPITFAGTVDARSRKNGGDGGILIASSGKMLTLQTTAVLNADGHNTLTNGEDGQGGIILLQGCQVDVQDTASTGAIVTALGAYGGSSSIEGSKSPLGAQEYSVRVGNKALVDVTGELEHGQSFLEVTHRRLGKCSNNLNATCQASTECVFSCTTGTCDFANPDTQSYLTQLKPTVTIEQQSGLFPCSACN